MNDDEAIGWLRACLWPDVPGRIERFDAAVDVARAEPPPLVAGDAVDLIDEAVKAVPDGVLPCLVSTWVLAYLDPRARVALQARVEALAQHRRLAYITAEYEMTVPWLGPASRRPTVTGGELPTRLGLAVWDQGGLETRLLAWMHAHARWLEWLDEP